MSILGRSTRSVGRRTVPWLLVLELLREGQAHWKDQLSARDRKRLIELLKTSKGRPGNLSEREQREVRELTAKLDVKAFGRRAALTGVGVGSRRR